MYDSYIMNHTGSASLIVNGNQLFIIICHFFEYAYKLYDITVGA